MTKQPINVDAYNRRGKRVNKHIRRAGKKAHQSLTNNRDIIEIEDFEDIGILNVPAQVYEQLKAQVDTPMNILKRAGLTPAHLKSLVDANGIDGDGNVMIKNRRNGEGMKVKVFDFQNAKKEMW